MHRAVKSKFGNKTFLDPQIRDAEEQYLEEYAKDKCVWIDNYDHNTHPHTHVVKRFQNVSLTSTINNIVLKMIEEANVVKRFQNVSLTRTINNRVYLSH